MTKSNNKEEVKPLEVYCAIGPNKELDINSLYNPCDLGPAGVFCHDSGFKLIKVVITPVSSTADWERMYEDMCKEAGALEAKVKELSEALNNESQELAECRADLHNHKSKLTAQSEVIEKAEKCAKPLVEDLKCVCCTGYKCMRCAFLESLSEISSLMKKGGV